MNDDVTIVIRAAGERTEEACRILLEQQVASENIFVIHEKPFRKAVEKNFQIGIEQDKKWTLAVDADLLLGENAVQEMILAAENWGDNLYIYQGYVVDKIFGGPRQGGPHLYRTQHLLRALSVLSDNNSNYRPESSTYRRLAQENLITYVDNKVFGLHDYKQYYKDLYRKAFFHAKKHLHLGLDFIQYWGIKAKSDLTYRVLLQGWVSGVIHQGEIIVDYDFFKHIVDQELPQLGIQEKSPLPIVLDDLSKLIQSEISDKASFNLSTRKLPRPKPSWLKRIKNRSGNWLIKIGESLKA